MFDALREANVTRQREWDRGDLITLSFRLNELAGEAGEACNILKKFAREELGIDGSRATNDDLAEELGDIVICCDLVAMTAGVSVETLAEQVVEESRVPHSTWVTMDQLGNALMARTGRCSALAESKSLGLDEDKVRIARRLARVMIIASIIAARRKIVLDYAIENKFNLTSAKVGLTTRLVLTSNQR